jgi:hypothetical protein
MAEPKSLTITLLSDATFGRGEGTAGEVDVEVEHDKDGLPFIGGKTIHGLLRETWLSMRPAFPNLEQAATQMLGPEADLQETAILRIGDALLPDDVRQWMYYAVHRRNHALRPKHVLHSLTDIRRQTSQSRQTGAPEETTLRASRIVLRQTKFHAPLAWLHPPGNLCLQVLALCALGTRHGGLGRNRGRGFLQVTLDLDLQQTRTWAGIGGMR